VVCDYARGILNKGAQKQLQLLPVALLGRNFGRLRCAKSPKDDIFGHFGRQPVTYGQTHAYPRLSWLYIVSIERPETAHTFLSGFSEARATFVVKNCYPTHALKKVSEMAIFAYFQQCSRCFFAYIFYGKLRGVVIERFRAYRAIAQPRG
jgi:hypothetical protein